ncbi:hypothetical protein [Schaalia cardiffensis]
MSRPALASSVGLPVDVVSAILITGWEGSSALSVPFVGADTGPRARTAETTAPISDAEDNIDTPETHVTTQKKIARTDTIG